MLCREERAVRVDVQSSRGRINEEGWNSLESARTRPLVLNRVGRAHIRNNREASCHYCYLIGDCIVAAGCSQLAELRAWGGPSPCSALVHMRMTLTVGRIWHLQLLLISSLTTAAFLYPALPLFTQTPLLFLFHTFSPSLSVLISPLHLTFPFTVFTVIMSFVKALAPGTKPSPDRLYSSISHLHAMFHSNCTASVTDARHQDPHTPTIREKHLLLQAAPVLFFSPPVLWLCAHVWVWLHTSASLPRTYTKRCLFCPYGLVYQAFSKSHGKSQTEKKHAWELVKYRQQNKSAVRIYAEKLPLNIKGNSFELKCSLIVLIKVPVVTKGSLYGPGEAKPQSQIYSDSFQRVSYWWGKTKPFYKPDVWILAASFYSERATRRQRSHGSSSFSHQPSLSTKHSTYTERYLS